MRFVNQVQNVLFGAALLAIMCSQHFAAAQCEDSFFPIYAGGSKGSEDVRCFEYDEHNELIIVGGVTSSSDFGPASDNYGYLFALDLAGNWKWGSYYGKNQFKLSSVDGCKISRDRKSIAVTGLYNNLPGLIDLNTVDGNFRRFI